MLGYLFDEKFFVLPELYLKPFSKKTKVLGFLCLFSPCLLKILAPLKTMPVKNNYRHCLMNYGETTYPIIM